MSQINFYILPAHKPLIPFVCQLTQTALNKSQDGLLMLMPSVLLADVDSQLWSFSDTAFIPHDIIPAAYTLTQVTSPASVLLTDNVNHVGDFDGIVLNLTPTPLIQFNGIKLLEIITADEASLAAGRDKYRQYQTHFPQISLNTYRI